MAKGRLHLVGGMLVEHDALRIVEKIRERWPELKVQYLESAPVTLNEPPFQLVEICKDGVERLVFRFWELDDRVIDRILACDTHYTNPNENSIANNEQVRKENLQRFRERIGEASDIAHSVLRSPKDTYTVNDPETGQKLKFTN